METVIPVDLERPTNFCKIFVNDGCKVLNPGQSDGYEDFNLTPALAIYRFYATLINI